MRRRFINYSTSLDYSNYLTIEAIEDVSVLFDVEVQWTINGIKWESSNRVIAKAGQLVSIKRNTTQGELISTIWDEGSYNLKGNIMSLLFGDDAKGQTSMLGYTFSGLFANSNVISVDKDFLPATTLTNSCYSNMFDGCRRLTTAPELPATTLAEYCYAFMFCNCSNLTSAPELPATTLADSCYADMFEDCTSLTIAPSILPATTLAENCCYAMFRCCSSLTTAPELPATTLDSYCYYGMFQNCSSLTTAPALPAATLKDYCYYYMFQSCSNLNYIKMLATDISASNCLTNWVNGVSSTGTFVKNPAIISLPTDYSYSGIPEGWTVVNDGEE